MSYPQRLYYLHNWSDEAMPCAPTLEAWAAWLSKPAPDWNRPEAEEDGVFDAYTIDLLADVFCVTRAGAWHFEGPKLAAGTDYVYVRHGDETTGWDPDNSFDVTSSDDALGQLAEILPPGDAGDRACLACTANGPRVRLRFNAGRLTIEGVIQ